MNDLLWVSLYGSSKDLNRKQRYEKNQNNLVEVDKIAGEFIRTDIDIGVSRIAIQIYYRCGDIGRTTVYAARGRIYMIGSNICKYRITG